MMLIASALAAAIELPGDAIRETVIEVGQTEAATLELRNPDDAPVPVRVYVAGDPGDGVRVHLDSGVVTVPPDSSTFVPYEVVVDADAQEGEISEVSLTVSRLDESSGHDGADRPPPSVRLVTMIGADEEP